MGEKKNIEEQEKACYVLGLDIGSASVGYALVDKKEGKVLKMGSHTFDLPEDPKTGESDKSDRGMKIRVRRLVKRRARRLRLVRNLFEGQKLFETKFYKTEKGKLKKHYIKDGLTYEKLEEFLTAEEKDAWELRSEGLTRKLSEIEWVKVLYHIACHRGFKSNRKDRVVENTGKEEKIEKSEAEKKADEEKGKINAALETFEKGFREKGYQTAGQYIFKTTTPTETKRNRGAGVYRFFIKRVLLEEEVQILFEKQRALGNPFTSKEFQESYTKETFFQRPLKSSVDKVGNCAFEPKEKRASKYSFSFFYFRFLEMLVKLSIYRNGKKEELSVEQIKHLVDTVFEGEKKKITYGDLYKALDLKDTDRIWLLSNSKKKKDVPKKDSSKNLKDEKETVFLDKSFYSGVKNLLREKLGESVWEELKKGYYEKIDQIINAIAFEEEEESMRKKLEALSIDEKMVNFFLGDEMLGFLNQIKGVASVSTLFLRKIIPCMEEGLVYSEACEKAGYDHTKDVDGSRLDAIQNHLVKRGVSEVLKVFSAIKNFAKNQNPSINIDKINIEVARDMARNASERNNIKKEQENSRVLNEKANEELRLKFPDFSIRGRDDRNMIRFWEEQDKKCLYCFEPIVDREIINGNIQVDHILPYSRSFNDSMSNKVVTCVTCNQQKENRTPYEWFGQDTSRWDKFKILVEKYYPMENEYLKRKRENLLLEDFKEKEGGFKNRSINDTRYITRLMMEFLRKEMKKNEKENEEKKSKVGENKDNETRKVYTRAGLVTSNLRIFWGLESLKKETKEDGTKERIQDDRHHALDALVIALTEESVMQKMTRLGKMYPGVLFTLKEGNEKPEETRKRLQKEHSKLEKFDGKGGFGDGTVNIRKLAETEMEKIFVSRASKKKMTGSAHNETVYSVPRRKVVHKKDFLKDLIGGEKSTIHEGDRDNILRELLRQKWIKSNENVESANFSFVGTLERETYEKEIDEVLKDFKESNIRKAVIEELTAKEYFARLSLESLTKESLEKLLDKDRHKDLYEALKKRLEENGWDGKKAFSKALPVFKHPSTGQVLRKVTVRTKQEPSRREIDRGMVGNGSMVRVDVFYKKTVNKKGEVKKSYHLVPIYVYQTMEKIPPNEAIVAHKEKEDWDVMNKEEGYEFLYSFYKNDYVEIVRENGQTDEGYYISTHSANGYLNLKHHSNREEKPAFVRTGVSCINKYHVDVLGNKHLITGEKRTWRKVIDAPKGKKVIWAPLE